MAKKELGSDVEQKQVVIVSVDKSNETVLNLNQDKSVVLDWDPEDFRELPGEIVDKLDIGNLKNYMVAETKWKEIVRRKAALAAEVPKVRIDPLGMHAEHRMNSKIPENRRNQTTMHLYWASDGADYDRCMASGYKQVRELSNEQKKAIAEGAKPPLPGYEDGEVIKLKDGEGRVELILLEVPMGLYHEHLEFVSETSQRRLGIEKEKFFTSVENLNSSAPLKSVRVTAIDGEKAVK